MAGWIFYLFLVPLAHLPLWWLAPWKRNYIHLIPGGFVFLFIVFLLANPAGWGDWQIPLWLGTYLGHPSSLLWTLEPHRLSMAALCSGLAWLIQWYSYGYFVGKQRFALYQFLLSCFSAAMIWLFLAGNLFTLLLGWEWVGLVSFLLVQFWFEKERPIEAGFRVLLINKMGDAFLLASLGLLFAFGLGHLVFVDFRYPAGAEVFFQSKTGTLLGFLLLLSAMVKSAQFPFNIWLKEAMEGPTAVSALLHSATMVTAGVWLLLHCMPIFSTPVLVTMVVVGAITLLLANLGALFSSQIKTTLAFSTMAQLGLMVLALGIGKTEGVKLHLFGHAFFKSALFLMAGVLLHQADKQAQGKEIGIMKGMFSGQLIMKWTWTLALLSLAGVPLTAGFISKESLMPHVFGNESDAIHWLAFFIMQTGIGMTAFYAFRLLFWIGWKKPVIESENLISWLMKWPVLLLTFGFGFWIFGPNPFSAQGWLGSFWGIEGHSMVPDVFMVLVGALGAWFSFRNEATFSWKKMDHISMIFSDLTFQYKIISSFGKNGFRMAKGSLWLENRLLEMPLIFFSKVGVVSGHVVSFFDRKVVDGFYNGLIGLGKFSGTYFWRQASGKPQQSVFLVIFFLLLILLWMAIR